MKAMTPRRIVIATAVAGASLPGVAWWLAGVSAAAPCSSRGRPSTYYHNEMWKQEAIAPAAAGCAAPVHLWLAPLPDRSGAVAVDGQARRLKRFHKGTWSELAISAGKPSANVGLLKAYATNKAAWVLPSPLQLGRTFVPETPLGSATFSTPLDYVYTRAASPQAHQLEDVSFFPLPP